MNKIDRAGPSPVKHAKAAAAYLGRYVLLLLLALIFLTTAGTLFPSIPFLWVGTIFVTFFGPWVMFVLGGGVMVSIRLWKRSGQRRHVVLAAISLLSLIGIGIAETRHLMLAHAYSLPIQLTRALWLGPVPHRGQPAKRLIYAWFGKEPLPILIYRPAKRPPVAGPAPILVYVHGGGWISGEETSRSPDMRWFSDRGYLVFSVGYTLSDDTRHLWDTSQGQIGCALAWIGRHAATFGGDPRRIVMWGESAGGNLVLTVPYSANTGQLRPTCAGPVPRVAATVALYPVIDVARFHDNPDPAVGGFARQMASGYIGGSPQRYPVRYAFVSPESYISPGAPPTLLIVGQSDHLVTPGPAEDFASRARHAGVDTVLVSVPNAEHAFDMMSGSFANQIVRQATIRFLAKRGLAP